MIFILGHMMKYCWPSMLQEPSRARSIRMLDYVMEYLTMLFDVEIYFYCQGIFCPP
jgi:hypothetical protein